VVETSLGRDLASECHGYTMVIICPIVLEKLFREKVFRLMHRIMRKCVVKGLTN